MSKRILVVLSERGYWGEELLGPLEMFDKAGYQVDFATPKGKRPVALPPSMDANLHRSAARADRHLCNEVAEKCRDLDKRPRLDNPISLEEMMPERPYCSSPTFIRDMEQYHKAVDTAAQDVLSKYDALLIVGGSGPIVDMVNNQRVHDVILGFRSQDKPIAAECYGVACLAFARDWEDRKSII